MKIALTTCVTYVIISRPSDDCNKIVFKLIFKIKIEIVSSCGFASTPITNTTSSTRSSRVVQCLWVSLVSFLIIRRRISSKNRAETLELLIETIGYTLLVWPTFSKTWFVANKGKHSPKVKVEPFKSGFLHFQSFLRVKISTLQSTTLREKHSETPRGYWYSTKTCRIPHIYEYPVPQEKIEIQPIIRWPQTIISTIIIIIVIITIIIVMIICRV